MVIVILGLAIIGLMMYILPYRYRLNQTEVFSQTNEQLHNPLTGFAPPANKEEECKDSQLVYIGLTWAQWEPREGEYAIEALEESFHIKRWKEEGKHAVLRFVCDVPGEAGHKDIPEWLYQKTKDGSFYDTAYGAGYAPDYSNSCLLYTSRCV